MISFFEANLKALSVHQTGNKLLEENYKLSDQPLNIADDMLSNLLMQYFLKPFEKTNEVFRFFHNSDLSLNEVCNYAKAIFEGASFQEQTELIAKHLYDVANHPKIKAGELYVAYFENVQIEGELLNAIGIFKSETKDTYLKVFPDANGFKMSYEQDGVSINRLDKGCLIFNADVSEGYKVVVLDQSKTQNNTAIYWKDEFLKLKVRNDTYNQTVNLLGVYKSFVNNKLDEDFEISRTEKVDLLNKSIKYFKDKETFDLQEFGADVFTGNAEVINSFNHYKKSYEAEFETSIPDSFDISDSAVKSSSRGFKSLIKLDKNFHIYLHGSKELIEKGFDEDEALNYYKLYFREEN